MNRKIIFLLAFIMPLVSCGLSEEARQLEETNLDLAARLRRAESEAIPALNKHIDTLSAVVDANQGVQAKLDTARASVSRANETLAAVAAAVPESATAQQESVFPQEVPEELTSAATSEASRVAQHNENARTISSLVDRVNDVRESLSGATESLGDASEQNQNVTRAVSDEIVSVAETTENLSNQLDEASSVADDAAARARSIRDKADIANIVGGAIGGLIDQIPIPGLNIVTGSLPKPDTVVPRNPMTAGSSDDGFPYWLIPVLLGGGGVTSLASKKVRGGIGSIFTSKTTTTSDVSAPKGPGQSSDARFLGEALMRLEAQEKTERTATRDKDVEDELERILAERRQRRAVLDRQKDQYENIGGQRPGQSSVFSVPTGIQQTG